jgi:anti-sigma factor RsiW
MTTHIEGERLHDYVDGLLGAAERATIERHLEACAECTTSVHELRALLGDIAGLPRGIAPARDLLAAIGAAIDAGSGEARALRLPLRERTVWSARHALAAAAIVLVALTSAVTALVVRTAAVPSDVLAVSAPGAFEPEEFRRIEANYIAATDELEAVLASGRGALAPETVRILEENLRIIDAALAEAGAALRSDPGNAALSEMMVAAYEKKLDLLRRAAQDPTWRGGA